MSIENAFKGIAALVALASFVFGIFKFLEVQAVEAEKPYLERKLAWCEEAVETTARLGTSSEPTRMDLERFWQMYWGVMGMIERETITDAMREFGDFVDQIPAQTDGSIVIPEHIQRNLRGRSLALAHACREELSVEWAPSWAIVR